MKENYNAAYDEDDNQEEELTAPAPAAVYQPQAVAPLANPVIRSFDSPVASAQNTVPETVQRQEVPIAKSQAQPLPVAQPAARPQPPVQPAAPSVPAAFQVPLQPATPATASYSFPLPPTPYAAVPTNIRSLLHRSESETLDFKRDQYPFYGKLPDVAQEELLKDILAFANAWKDADAHIIVGVAEVDGRASEIPGTTSNLKDNDVQEFVNKKTNRPVSFLVEVIQHEGVALNIIKINQAQSRPIFLANDFGRLRKNIVYIRRGSSTAEATPDELLDMGREEAKETYEVQRPAITLRFEYVLQTLAVSSVPFGLVQQDYEYYTVHVLRVVARNDGPILARHVQASVVLPVALLWHRLNPGQLLERIKTLNPTTLSLDNELSDPGPTPLYIPSKPKLRPLLSNCELVLREEKLLPSPEFADLGSASINWSVQGDNAIASTGIILLQDIPRVDERTEPDAPFEWERAKR